ncbi:hypothetical protein Vlu01_33810 [Micromonospora lutea]|uniref:Uncharacterized protein n=1 Tax=Micromonospora lutea TaxID=419825 RepID=A0ABQ4IY16_9ACTN|nr:hypothetical protein Vlu01_33810 [Micromonospora lutea]
MHADAVGMGVGWTCGVQALAASRTAAAVANAKVRGVVTMADSVRPTSVGIEGSSHRAGRDWRSRPPVTTDPVRVATQGDCENPSP